MTVRHYSPVQATTLVTDLQRLLVLSKAEALTDQFLVVGQKHLYHTVSSCFLFSLPGVLRRGISARMQNPSLFSYQNVPPSMSIRSCICCKPKPGVTLLQPMPLSLTDTSSTPSSIWHRTWTRVVSLVEVTLGGLVDLLGAHFAVADFWMPRQAIPNGIYDRIFSLIDEKTKGMT